MNIFTVCHITNQKFPWLDRRIAAASAVMMALCPTTVEERERSQKATLSIYQLQLQVFGGMFNPYLQT